jgi:hypothetical protein
VDNSYSLPLTRHGVGSIRLIEKVCCGHIELIMVRYL